MNKWQSFEIGREYGWLTVLQEDEKDKHGHRQFLVTCRCGKQYTVTSSFLRKKEPKCWECSHSYDMANRRRIIENSDINGWHVFSCVEHYDMRYIYECRCLQCGTISYKTEGELQSCCSGRCQHCPPDYNFSFHGSYAEGILPDGTVFFVDTELVDAVNKHHWRRNSQGYIVSTDNKHKLLLHRMALGLDNDDAQIVDHLSRNKLDCRRENLRIVTAQQNSMNKSISRNNTTGYVGVTFHKRKQLFSAKIVLNNRAIYLGYSSNPVVCAQRYNYAAKALFQQFAGHLNDVPELDESEQRIVDVKLAPYLFDAVCATREVSTI